MNAHSHTLNELFLQLGLACEDQDIQAFVQTHKLTGQTIPLHKASFWSTSQSGFIKESWQDDSEWCHTIDNLDTWLRT
ncbi:DUF2789 family protein [Parendozoicomonas sp. Alg238-R29]|uniref:DUF2789 family protein n=1 Tax=Parendozoicomonas sp. Alg238-R29 TaxID=2993446 RepID=UPI00248D63F8|nr:DUF2789 family protein [Parendozoicomonas sp. Alg238-R29]